MCTDDCCRPAARQLMQLAIQGTAGRRTLSRKVTKMTRGTVGTLFFGTVPEILSSAERAFSAVLFACLSALR